MSDTPIMDKYKLHPFGGYANTYRPGEFEHLVEEQNERRKLMTPEERKQVQKEMDRAYPRTSNQDGR